MEATKKKAPITGQLRAMKPGSEKKIPRATTKNSVVLATIYRLTTDEDMQFSTRKTPSYTIVTKIK